MYRAFFAAVVAAAFAAPAANAQQILSQKRTVYAYSQTQELVGDLCLHEGSDSDSTTAAGLWDRRVTAFTNFPEYNHGTNYGTSGARQTTTIDTTALSFSGDAATSAETQFDDGADSIAGCSATLEITFKLDQAGGISLNGVLATDGWTWDPDDAELIDSIYTTLEVINTTTGEVVFSRIATFADSVALLDHDIALCAGTYKVVVTTFAEANTSPNEFGVYLYNPNTYFNVTGQIYHNE